MTKQSEYRAFIFKRNSIPVSFASYMEGPFRYDTMKEALTMMGRSYQRWLKNCPEDKDVVGVLLRRDGELTLVELAQFNDRSAHPTYS